MNALDLLDLRWRPSPNHRSRNGHAPICGNPPSTRGPFDGHSSPACCDAGTQRTLACRRCCDTGSPGRVGAHACTSVATSLPSFAECSRRASQSPCGVDSCIGDSCTGDLASSPPGLGRQVFPTRIGGSTWSYAPPSRPSRSSSRTSHGSRATPANSSTRQAGPHRAPAFPETALGLVSFCEYSTTCREKQCI